MKKRRSSSSFSQEDKHLWKRVAQTTTPLSPRRGKMLEAEMARLMDDTADTAKDRQSAALPPAFFKPISTDTRTANTSPKLSSAKHHPIEERIVKKLAKGRLNIDSRIDLHGMTQDRARFALLDFLQMAQRSDWRIVLVITGKGTDGQGILRRAVPHWFALPQFKMLVNGFRESHVSHGGGGALYVRVRKPGNRTRPAG